MDTRPIKAVKVEGEAGEKVDRDELKQEYGISVQENHFIDKKITKAWNENRLPPINDAERIVEALAEKGIYDTEDKEEIKFSESKCPKLHEFANKIPANKVGIIENGSLKLFNRYRDKGDREIWLSPDTNGVPEFAEDLSALYDNVPDQENYRGDRTYVINGKLVSAWALYYGRNAIGSPEDYQKNVDLVWNVPYLFGSLELKAQMGLGADFKVSDENNEQESEVEQWSEWLLKHKLNIDTEFRKTCSFHEDLYGNYYIHIHRDDEGIADKLTILQPERVRVYLDPLTTKVLFYMYLPPIMGGTIMDSYPVATQKMSPRSDVSSLTGMSSPSLRFPVPIIIPVNNMIHKKSHSYTEYPFGFSCLKPCTEVAQTRFDCNIMVPYYFKKYIKPTIHWFYEGEGMGTKFKDAKQNITSELENAEPGSDLITTARWKSEVIQASEGQSEIYAMLDDCDNQIFACTGVPETYFKPKGTTDRMVSNEDKTFLGSLRQRQQKFAESIRRKIIIPAINKKFGTKKPEGLQVEVAAVGGRVINKGVGSEMLRAEDIMTDTKYNPDEPLSEFENYYKMDYPFIEFEDITKTDITQEIANVNAMLNNDIITHERAAQKLGEKFDPELREYIKSMREAEIEEMESKIMDENEYQSSSYTNQKGGLDMNKDERNSEISNPEGKYKKADNKLGGSKSDDVKKPSDGRKTETADLSNYLKIEGEKIPILKGK